MREEQQFPGDAQQQFKACFSGGRHSINPDGERSAGSTIQGQVCRQLGTTPVGEGSELVAGVDVILTDVSEAGVEGVHDGGRQATGQGGFGQDGTAGGNALQGIFFTRISREVNGFPTGSTAALVAETEMEKAAADDVNASTNDTSPPPPPPNHTHTHTHTHC